MFNRDQIHQADTDKVARATFAVLNQLQYFNPGEQALAAGCVFLVLCEHFKLPAQDAFTAVKNMLNDEKNVAEFNAVKDYVKYEIKT